jgi:xylulose-5-phosphate/fructose-6-phosphate phosphoketolase
MVANTYLEGTYSEIYPSIRQDANGLRRLFRQFSFPGGIPSHDLIVACVVGDGEAETGPLAASWHCSTFLNPGSDGAVLPILHLNGYKIASRMPDDEVVGLRLPCPRQMDQRGARLNKVMTAKAKSIIPHV